MKLLNTHFWSVGRKWWEDEEARLKREKAGLRPSVLADAEVEEGLLAPRRLKPPALGPSAKRPHGRGRSARRHVLG